MVIGKGTASQAAEKLEFNFVLKGRSFSRAVSIKINAGLAAEGRFGPASAFRRLCLRRAICPTLQYYLAKDGQK
jgi:hypothetical protein